MKRCREILLALCAILAVAPHGAAAPARVVSLHLCADQLLLKLADRDQIAALSRFANDPERSYMAKAARGLPAIEGVAEEVVARKPDLVLAGVYSARATVRLLRRLGFTVMDLHQPAGFAAIRAQIQKVAIALGHARRGEALIAQMDRRLTAIESRITTTARPVAVIYQPRGVTMGRGHLEDEILTAAGLENLAARGGHVGAMHLPLERLVAAHPDLLVFGAGASAPPSLAQTLLSHPAIRKTAPGIASLTLPPALWTCGGWFAVEAVERLAAARARVMVRKEGAR